jgi:HAD superfamily hydrolase (TIGR01549 family)
MGLVRTSAVFLDVGFTLTFLDGGRLADIAARQGLLLGKGAIESIEGQARRELSNFPWAATPAQVAANPELARGGERFFARVLELADARRRDGARPTPEERLGTGAAIWAEHLQRNVWSRIGDRVEEAVMRLARAKVLLAVVSNSEGTVAQLLREVGLAESMTTIVDSWVVGVSKPDPAIYEIALARLGVAAKDVTMVGDSLVNDVQGPRARGIQAALLDPFGDVDEKELARDGIARFPDLFAFVDAFLGASPRS